MAESLRNYYEFQHMKKVGEDQEIMNTIPMALRTKIMVSLPGAPITYSP